uniref:Transmembrane protein n=1 Tax=Angiostrongylus cantonensis TaxID=6313 RepID=A0A0K0DJR1_ANGCA
MPWLADLNGGYGRRFREEFWAKMYLNRSTFPAPESLEDLVESEVDKLGSLKHAKVLVCLTDHSEPRVYGGFFLKPGVELQLPLNVSFDDVEQARRLANNIEVDLGLARSRRKIEVNSKIGDELISRMMLSDFAKKFVVQRLSKVVGIALAALLGVAINSLAFSRFYRSYNAYRTKWADERAVDLGADYLQGAREYFNSTMKFNRLLRVILGVEGEKNISRNGDRKKWNEIATTFLQTKTGRRVRIALLGLTVVTYPVVSVLTNGPFVDYSFPWRYSVDQLPERLQIIADQEYARFLETETRVPKDAVVTHHIGKSIGQYETLAAGSLGVRTGLHLAVPFHVRFKDVEEALEYFRKNDVRHIETLGVKVPVKWDTTEGKELASAFVLSDDALRFVFLRDLFAHDGYSALAERSISWSTWTTFTSIFTYWLHNSSKMLGGTASSFISLYVFFVSVAWFANRQWDYLYSVAARSSFNLCEGGKEWYWKQLKQFRIMRDISSDLKARVTASGDIRGIPTSIIVRFDHLKVGKFTEKQVVVRIFVQWVISAGIFCVGMAVYALESFPLFQPLAMLGGSLWALGNATAVPIMNVLGLGMGMLIWGVTNCVTGWAVGRFGLFGINASIPTLPLLNYFGLLLVIIGCVFFSQMRPTAFVVTNDGNFGVEENGLDRDDPENSPLLNPDEPVTVGRNNKRILAIFVALVAGIFYGVTFVPNRPVVNSRVIGPSLMAGFMWGIAQSSWFVANDNLSQSVTFPIITTMPGVGAAIWSVFYFREITGKRNLRVLTGATLITITGAILVGISK